MQKPIEALIDINQPAIQKEIIQLIVQYLSSIGYTKSVEAINNELNEVTVPIYRNTDIFQLITDGSWETIMEKKSELELDDANWFSIYRQWYLELIDSQNKLKALEVLNKYLKSVEKSENYTGEFKELIYLLTVNKVTIKGWDNILSSRSRLVRRLKTQYENQNKKIHFVWKNKLSIDDRDFKLPPNRLLSLLQQAVAYQVEISQCHPHITPTVETLIEDYRSFTIPNKSGFQLQGHAKNIKCLQFINDQSSTLVVSGSGDKSIRIWDINPSLENDKNRMVKVISNAHEARIWDLAVSTEHNILASASGDRTVKMWDWNKGTLLATLPLHSKDVYSTCFHPNKNQIASAGYDKLVTITDTTALKPLIVLTGHEMGISQVSYNNYGSFLVTGSKDCSIRFWDANIGPNQGPVHTIDSHLGEVTHIQLHHTKPYLLSSSKDNSNRLWDIRMLKPVQRFRGHQNTSKNFIRARFGDPSLIFGGSEDGRVYIWDQNHGTLLSRLHGHNGTVFDALYHSVLGVLISASQDCTLKSWSYISEN